MRLAKIMSPEVQDRLRSTFAGMCYGFGASVVANQVSLNVGLFVIVVGAAIQAYGLWPFQRVMQKVLASGGVLAIGALLIFVTPMILEGWDAKLYYAERKLDGAKITLGRRNPDPRLCTAMHVWATIPTGIPDSFGLCGVWMKKPDDAASTTAFALYLDFSEEVTDRSGACRISNEKPATGYKVALVCQGWPIPSPSRWTLPAFFGLPIPVRDTKVRMRFDYGKNRVAEATFTLRPPDR